MAEEEKDKTEPASSYKLARAREKGQVARGLDLGFLAGLAGATGFLWASGDELRDALEIAIYRAAVGGPNIGEGQSAVFGAMPEIAGPTLHILGLMFGAMFLLVLLAEIVQTGVIFSSAPLKPDFTRLNPVNGFKRVFSFRQLIETGKNILKLAVYSVVAFLILRSALSGAEGQIGDATRLGARIASAAFHLAATFLGVALIFAVLDQLIVRRDFSRKMRMSRREQRREHRDREGEPRMKQKRKQLHAEFVKLSQSLRGIRNADVLITNPQHIAVGLRYDGRTMSAPNVVAIGTNRVALRLKRLAFLYGVTIIENKLLARELLRHAVQDRPIPDHCFAPVAAIYRKMRKNETSQTQAAARAEQTNDCVHEE